MNMVDMSLFPDNTVQEDELEEAREVVQLCIFELSDKLFGLNIFEVQKIIEHTEITPVPTTPHFLRGVINQRGNIVPIVDIREILHLPVKPNTRESRIMILNINRVHIGIFVDAIKEIRHLEKRQIEPETVLVGISDGKFISNIIQYHDELLVLLNLEELYAAIQL